ncbi:fungal-specific transcription factor domain-containing protein [Mycena sanguinolenta]|nr:fungal-specific transcription factor domain-containing protein [Mycena sanguinolenta]
MASTSANDEEFPQAKKRRLQRACDVCRRKKAACDGSQMPGEKCTTCIGSNLECTYVEVAAKRPPPNSFLDLETRLENSDAVVRQLRAELATVRAELARSHFAPNARSPNSGSIPDTNRIADPNANTEDFDVPAAALCIMRSTLRNIIATPTAPHVDDVLDLSIGSQFEKLNVGSGENSFIGKSSVAFLMNAALDLKPDEDGKDSPPQSVDGREAKPAKGLGAWTSRRLRYWTWKPRDDPVPRTSPFKFPPEALMSDLFELYFTQHNAFVPLLHRPTFERAVAEELHSRDDSFAGTVLLVCAIGSRWSVDPSVASAGLDCGAEWFDQVQLTGNRSSLLGRGTLYDVQRYCLAAQFLRAASMPQSYWTLIGLGLRLAQDLGFHRGKSRNQVPSAERELQKRAFWVLMYLDRVASCILGRTCSMQFSDFDIEPLLEVDDEYWEHPTHPFQQPAHKPPRVAFFNTLMRLNHILAFTLQILYSLNKVRVASSITDSWEEQAIAELDSALNNWRDQVPDHLRWDPLRTDPVFFDQSVILWCSYYHLQITIHRPFIPMLRRAPTALPALTICTNAARACANVADVQMRRNGSVPSPLNLNTVVLSGMVLVLSLLSGKRSGLLADPSREMVNVHKCMKAISLCESRWQTAGMLWDVLTELASVGQLQLPIAATATTTPKSHGVMNHIGDHITSQVRDDSPSSDDPWRIFLGSPNLRQTSDLPSLPTQFFAASRPKPQSTFGGVIGNPDLVSFTPASFAPAPAVVRPEDMVTDIYTDPTQASRELANMMNSDAMAVWTNLPRGMGVDDWGAYFSSFSDMTQGDEWSATQPMY